MCAGECQLPSPERKHIRGRCLALLRVIAIRPRKSTVNCRNSDFASVIPLKAKSRI